MPPAARLIVEEVTAARGVALSEIYDSKIHTIRVVAARHEIFRRIYALKNSKSNNHNTAYSKANIARWFGFHHSTLSLALDGKK
jgi:hypothetical protein